MIRGPTYQEFITQTISEFGTVPKRGLIYIASASALSAITELIHWHVGAKLPNFDYVFIGIATSSWFIATYVTTMMMIEKQSSVIGFF